jgi:hypothetical protein
MADDLHALKKLTEDPLLAQVESHIPSLSFFHLLDCTRNEIVHSRVIGILFDPRHHREADTALRSFIASIEGELDATQAGLKRKLAKAVSSSWTKLRVRREVFRIDVVIEIFSSVGDFVIGIENKIDADEQRDQVARYQESLDRAYPRHTAVVVFLSPTKRRPSTADATSRVPCVVLGYSAVIAAIQASLDQNTLESAEVRVLQELERHLGEDILGDQQIRKVVRKLWKTHGRALELAIEHRPRMIDVKESYERRLRDRLGGDVDFWYYPSRGELREIQLTLPSWESAGVPVTFMFYAGKGEPPHVRLLIYGKSYERRSRLLREWALNVNLVIGDCLDESFRPVSDWSVWRRVFREDDYPADAVLNERGFDEETAKEAADRVFSLIELLEPHI